MPGCAGDLSRARRGLGGGRHRHPQGGPRRRRRSRRARRADTRAEGRRRWRDGPRLPLRSRREGAAARALRGPARDRGGRAPARRDPLPRGGCRDRRRAGGLSGHRRPPLLLRAGPAATCDRPRVLLLVRRQRDLRALRRSPRGGARRACRPTARRNRQPVPVAPAGAQEPKRARQRRPHRRRAGGGARGGCGGARRADGRERARGVRPAVSRLPAAKRRLGPHFLVDQNLLGVIDRLAGLGPDDVVLETGPGAGILTRFLAERVSFVHAVELDRSLEERLDDALRGLANVRVTYGDAVRLDLGALEPAPTKLVANLPYNVATPIVVESLDGLPGVRSWCVMVQLEVARRFFADPGTGDYGAVSVLMQLATRRTGFHPVSRTVFRPQPNVDSALVAFERTDRPDGWAELKRVVEASFA